ncbi:hypothetical protein K402DRAFT_419689 [Aulographum hederae CBS 113979]|uniref:Uncharacterized protein n=1 Tax=Aulographum hederae CBS 113979 TaxID=1176131 RepID=A0A6G1H5X2_9PEZI|nr:hypothetical protein K402DRAFT_419689 [Aulographum hederae CBS 113979]
MVNVVKQEHTGELIADLIELIANTNSATETPPSRMNLPQHPIAGRASESNEIDLAIKFLKKAKHSHNTTEELKTLIKQHEKHIHELEGQLGRLFYELTVVKNHRVEYRDELAGAKEDIKYLMLDRDDYFETARAAEDKFGASEIALE